MTWSVVYHNQAVERFVLSLPDKLLARYLHLVEVMLDFGANLGMPHTRAMGAGLFELRVKGAEGIARVFYCTLTGHRIVILHGFIKKSEKAPTKELDIARERLAKVKRS